MPRLRDVQVVPVSRGVDFDYHCAHT
jgi:hypothetical protein